MEPACLGRIAHTSRLLLVTARVSRVSSAPGSKSGMKTAELWASRRVVLLRPLAEMLTRSCAASGAAVTLTAELFTIALSWTWRSWFDDVSCSVLEKA